MNANIMTQAQNNVAGYNAPAPVEPSIMGRTNEILNHIATAEMHLSRLNGDLFGAGCESQPQATPTTLERMLADACSRIACICGDLATISSRLGIGESSSTKSLVGSSLNYQR